MTMKAEVRQHMGTPALFFEERPVFAGYLWASAPTATGYRGAQGAAAYADAGIHLHAFDVGSGGTPPEWAGPAPARPDPFDFTTVEARFGRILDVDPDALFHLRMHLELRRGRNDWWLDRYPEECDLDSEGGRTTQSFASEVWRRESNEFLQAYIAHLQETGLDQHVIAYQVGAGHTGEWVKGHTSMWHVCGDYSLPMQTCFRDWLRRTYHDDVEALRSAWNDPSASFAAACVPSAQAQLTTTHMAFRDPRYEQPVIDAYRCLADRCADLIIDFSRTVKVATQGNALAGAFYGYLMELAWNAGFFGENVDSPYGTTQRSGHLGLHKVLESPHVDFLVSPYSYGFRGIGGFGCAMPPAESMRRHGKLFIVEDDTRTHLAPPDAGFGRAASPDDSVAVLKRNFAEVVTRGQGIWWLGESAHIDPVREPAFGPLLARFQELGTFALSLDRTPSAEIAVLVDDESFYYESLYNDLDLPLIFQQRLWGIPRLGAPSDTYLLRDLIEDRLPPYKLYILLNAFYLNEARREALLRQLRRDGRTALWLYAPGYIDQAPGQASMTELTGFTFGRGDHSWIQAMHLVAFDHPITTGLRQDLVWETGGKFGPQFHLEDEEATILGQIVYAQGRCKPGFGVKTFPEWTSIYSAVPNLPAPVLRGIARAAGVHLYSEDGDVLFASKQLFGAHTVSGGPRSFTLPSPVEVVYDLFEQRRVAEHTDQISVTLPPRSTALYYAGDTKGLAGLAT
jgi:hypothetical protein